MDSNHKEIKLFYTSFSIYNFATSMVQIFIPLYFFSRGFSLSQILIFFAISQAGRALFLPLGAHLSSAFGAKKIISVSFILTTLFYIFLSRVEDFSSMFYLSAIIFGAIQALLWLPFLIHLSKISPNEKKGRIFSKLNMYSAVANASGPILGGFIISFYGFEYVFYLVIGIVLFAIYFLSLTPEVSKIRKVNFKLINIKKVYPDLIANGAFNFQVYLANTLWPIFIFLILPQYNTIGFIQTVSVFLSLIALHYSGKWTDKFNRKKVLFFGSILNSSMGFLRIFANSFLSIFFFNASSIFSGTLQGVSWNVKLQEHMEKEPRIEYTTIFEMGGALITFIGLLIFMFAIQSVPLKDALIYGIIISSISGLFVNLIRE